MLEIKHIRKTFNAATMQIGKTWSWPPGGASDKLLPS